LTSSPFVNLPALPPSGQAASYALSLFSPNASRFLALEISALESDGKGRVVSSPRVVTADQVKALIEQGTEFPYQTATSSGATAIAFRKANLKLEVTPQITPEGNIILDLDVNKDTRGETTAEGIAIDTKHVQTQVLVENGGTVVIGGIFERTERNEIQKVPLLGDLPGVGNLFKSRNQLDQRSELLIFITPRVLGRTAIN
jgi:type IV pilus assembly protein PilQ